MTHAAGSPDFDALGALLEGSLEPEERARVEEHLSRCRECRETVAVFARARGVPRRPARAVSWLAAAAGILLATAVGVRVGSKASSSAPREPPAAEAPPEKSEVPGPPAAKEVAAPPEAAPAAPSVAPAPEEPLEVRRSGQKTVGEKTFRLIAGEWVDRDYDPDGDLETVAVVGADRRLELLSRVPALARFAAIGDRVVVVWEGKVYRFAPASR
ncbi:MAG: zf-HC2 domain-containing protein [Acidobacteriota bacterium]